MTAPLAAVTGATGFVGRHVVEHFAAAGWRLRLLVRRDPDLACGDRPVELIPGSLSDREALAELVRGADAVIHVAGAIKARNRAGFMTANADGTAAMAAAWRREAPEARFLMLSSLAAREPELSHYAASKAAGEAALRDAAGKGWCILRPAAIYGPGDVETLSVFKATRLPFHPLLNGPEARLTLIHVSDVARGVLAMASAAAPSAVFEMTDGRPEGYSWTEVVGTACAATGHRARPLRIPAGLVRLAGRAGDLAAAITGSAEMLTSQKIREILHPDWSSERASQLPAALWAPHVGLAEGFADAVAWYRAAGWLG